MVARAPRGRRLRRSYNASDECDSGSARGASRWPAIVFAMPCAAATLEEVVVTATRSPVALASYAGSATRIEAGTVALVGATHSSELVNRAAGAMIQRGSGQESLTALRSPVLTGAGACGSVLVLEDGIPIRPVGSCNVNELFEVNFEQAAAIEVLRGPGSVLYGSSAVHGIINVIPPMPEEIPVFGAVVEGGSDEYGAAAGRGLERTRQRRLRHRDARHRRRRLARLVRLRGGEAQRGVDARAGRRTVEALARGIEPQPGDGRLHRRPGCLPRPGDRALESRSRRLPQRTEPALRRAVPRGVGQSRRAFTCAARAWISSSISCSASRSRTTARTAAA